jgi:hypothetical protein
MVLLTMVVLLGLGVGWIVHRGPMVLSWVAWSLLLVAVIDLSGQFAGWLGALVAFAVAAAIVRLLWQHIPTIIMATGLAFLLSVSVLPQQGIGTEYSEDTESQSDASLPLVLHLILDEHGGLEGIPDEQLRGEILAFYEEWGFRIFPRAYSHYWDSYNSIPHLLNFSADSVDGAFIDAVEFAPAMGYRNRVGSNRYFATLTDLGYRIRVHQMTYMDFCRSEGIALASCFTYPTNTIWYLPQLSTDVLPGARILLAYFLTKQSFVFRQMAGFYQGPLQRSLASLNVALPSWDWSGDRVNPPPSLVTERLIADLNSGSRGEVWFAHYLLPHYPYQLGADCSPHSRVRQRLDRSSPNAPPGQSNTEESRLRRYELYADQARCLLRQLDDLMNALAARADLNDAIVIVQGDHGTRIGIREPFMEVYDGLTRQDLLDGFSSLFAVGGPGVSAGVDSTLIPIQELLRHFVESGFTWTEPDDPPVPFIYVMDVDSKEMRKRPYP